MPTIKIDGQEVPFEPGDTILRAAWRRGIEIPHYCWHPGLSVAANCRMCLVEITSARRMDLPVLRWDEGKSEFVGATKPKLQPACQLGCSEGMEVSTKNEHVAQAQSAVQELLLLNHPVDCPICDQAGECKLQDYWLAHQGKDKRKLTEPVHKPKAVRFGPTILYDAERCIMCTRCIRVCDELVGDHVLDMRERGNRNEIVLAPGRELDHRYTLMTEHVCPVGALTSKDFRFKARVWFLRSVPGVCTGCATGCNTHVDFDPRTDRVYRLRPRDNLDVNRFWMCDDGMMTYREVHEHRVATAWVGRGEQREGVPASEAARVAAERLGRLDGARVGVVLSAHASCEDNLAMHAFAREVLGTERIYVAARGAWEGDAILRHTDASPNRRGVEQIAGAEVESLEDCLQDVLGGELDALVTLGAQSAEGAAALAPLAGLRLVVSLTSHEGALPEIAHVGLPITAWAEQDGTFVNAKGTAQSFRRAVRPAPGVEPAFAVLSHIARAMGKALGYDGLPALRAALGAAASAGPSSGGAGASGGEASAS